MKKLLIGLLAIGSISAFAELPTIDGVVNSKEEIIKVLSSKHKELVSETCIQDYYTLSSSFTANIAVRGPVKSLQLSTKYNEEYSKTEVCLEPTFTDGQKKKDCGCFLK